MYTSPGEMASEADRLAGHEDGEAMLPSHRHDPGR